MELNWIEGVQRVHRTDAGARTDGDVDEVVRARRGTRARQLAVVALVLSAGLAACDSRDASGSVHSIEKTRIVERASTDLRLGTPTAERFGFAAPRRTEAREEPPSALAWDTPPGWEAIPVTSTRSANFRVGGDEGSECYLTLMPGDAGGLVSNVNRWRSQMSLAPISAADVAALPRKSLFGRDAAYVDFAGTWTGMSGRERGENHRLLGLLLIEPNGSTFLKMTGPSSVLDNEVEAFESLARSFRVGEAKSRANDPGSRANDPASRAGDPGSARDAGSDATPRSESAAPGLVWNAPPEWRRAADRATRAVSFFVGEGEDAECYVTLLAGDAGGPLANINRWRKQVGRDELSADDLARLERIPMLGTEAVIVEIEGQAAADGSTQMILGAVCSLGERAVFVKCTGPKAQVQPAWDAFKAFCSSLSIDR